MNLSKHIKFAHSLPFQPSGTSVVDGALVDMQDYEGVVGVCIANTITDGAAGIKAQGGNLADGSDMADLAGTNTALQTTDDGHLAILDVYRPTFRYIRFVAVRGGSTGSVLDGLLTMQYGPRVLPTIQDVTVGNTVLAISPVYGTA